MKNPWGDGTVVSVGELKRFLEESALEDDAPVGVIRVSEKGSPLPGGPFGFANRISIGKGHDAPDMLILSVPERPEPS
jgi:hypothetical protein